MFGRQDDVIRQDQKRDADVALPDSALDLLTAQNDSDAVSTDNPQAATPPPTAPPTDLPAVNGTAIDGISSPRTNSLASPFDLAEAHRRAQESNKSTSTEAPDNPESSQQNNSLEGSDVLEPQVEPEELSYNNEPSDSLSSILSDDTSDSDTAQYLSQLQDSNTNLTDIKQSALQQLAPLVGQLQLTPEDKFKTLMMLIQASDNQDLIPQAYEAAQAITDAQLRAQALLDVVNEINYFTQASDQTPKNS